MTTELMNEHLKENHTIEQHEDFYELKMATEKIGHDELWCEDQLSNRPAMKGHVDNEHHITTFENIINDKHGGVKWYRYPGDDGKKALCSLEV